MTPREPWFLAPERAAERAAFTQQFASPDCVDCVLGRCETDPLPASFEELTNDCSS